MSLNNTNQNKNYWILSLGASMTHISYPNITAFSPNKCYRLEIYGKLEEQTSFRDQSQFVYKLLCAKTSTTSH